MDLWAGWSGWARTTTKPWSICWPTTTACSLHHQRHALRSPGPGGLPGPGPPRLWEGRHQYDREKASPTTWLTAPVPQHRLRPPPRPAPPRISEELDPAVPTRPPDRRRRCFKRSGSSVCRRHWTSCPPGTAPSSTANITTSSPLPGLPPSWAPRSEPWREAHRIRKRLQTLLGGDAT